MLILKTREYQAGVQHLFNSSKQQCTTLVWSKTVDSFSLCSTLHRLLWFMITFSDPLYLYSGFSMFINLQQRLFGVGLQSLYRALQLSKFNQVKYAPFCLLSFLLRKLIRMRSSLDVLSKQLTSMKNGKVNRNALMPEMSLHSYFCPRRRKSKVFFVTSHWRTVTETLKWAV